MDQIVESYNVLISLFVEKFKVIRDDEINNLNKTMDGITKGKISFETFLIGVLYNTNDLIVINNIKKVNMRMEHVLYGVCDPPSAFEKLFIAKYEKGIEMLFIHNFIKAKFICLFKRHCKNPILLKYIDEKEQKYNVAITILAAKKYNRSNHPMFDQPKEIINKIINIFLQFPLAE